MRLAALLAIVVVFAVGCAGDDEVDSVFTTPTSTSTTTTTSAAAADDDAAASSSTSTTSTTTTTTLPIQGPDQATLDAVAVVGEPLEVIEQAIDIAFHPTSNTVLMAQRIGFVIDFTGARAGSTLIDLRDDLSLRGESGVLAITYDPAGTYLYVSYTDAADDTAIVAYPVDEAGFPDAANPIDVFTLVQPDIIHNGGYIRFGPDGYLYIGMGDGGPANDPNDLAQSLDSVFGKILRIDPRPGSEPAYVVPADNPFVDVEGAAPEVWAYGLRNPWKFGIDARTGDFYVGDVGQWNVEEINFMPGGEAGANFGWARLEGPIERGPIPDDYAPPLSYYRHDDDGRCAVIGGTVYRGTAIPELHGAYLYADYCDGQVRALTQVDGEVIAERMLGIFSPQFTGFIEDPGGELFVMNLAGETQKIVPADG